MADARRVDWAKLCCTQQASPSSLPPHQTSAVFCWTPQSGVSSARPGPQAQSILLLDSVSGAAQVAQARAAVTFAQQSSLLQQVWKLRAQGRSSSAVEVANFCSATPKLSSSLVIKLSSRVCKLSPAQSSYDKLCTEITSSLQGKALLVN